MGPKKRDDVASTGLGIGWKPAVPLCCHLINVFIPVPSSHPKNSKRMFMAAGSQGAAMMAPCAPVHALPGFKKDLNKRRKAKIPESEFKEGPQGLKYYDVVLGKGAEIKEGLEQLSTMKQDGEGSPL